MLRMLNKRSMLASQNLFLRSTSVRTYYPDNVLMPREKGEFYNDPMAMAESVCRIIAMHDACRDPANITVSHTFEQLGLNALDMVEVFIGCEREFDLEISEEACEEMTTVNDLVEHLARNPATKA